MRVGLPSEEDYERCGQSRYQGPPNLRSRPALLHAACFPEDPWDAEALGRILALSGGFGFVAWQLDMPVGFALARGLARAGSQIVLNGRNRDKLAA